MNLTLAQAFALLNVVDIKANSPGLIVCPPALHLNALHSAFPEISFGAQDCSSYSVGPHTGETSAFMLAELGCEYVIVGHSERRIGHGETNAIIADKLRLVLKAGMMPILCIGEPLMIREKNDTVEYLLAQLSSVLPDDEISIFVAYEPIWAIGSGLTPTICELDNILSAIKLRYPSLKLMYGGSVDLSNISSLYSIKHIEGLLVGGASTDAVKLNKLLKIK